MQTVRSAFSYFSSCVWPKRQRIAPSLLPHVLTSPDTGTCVLVFLDAPALAAVASVNTSLCTFVNGAAAVWGELLLIQWPHLAPLLPLPLLSEGNATKALYCERMLLDGKEGLSTLSNERERVRLQERLASMFMHVELRHKTSKCVLSSSAVPLWEEAKRSELFATGVEIVLQCVHLLLLGWGANNNELALEVVDLGGKGFKRTFTAVSESINWGPGEVLVFSPALSCIEAPQDFFPGCPSIRIDVGIERGPSGYHVRLTARRAETQVEKELDKWRVFEMIVDGRTTIE